MIARPPAVGPAGVGRLRYLGMHSWPSDSGRDGGPPVDSTDRAPPPPGPTAILPPGARPGPADARAGRPG